MRLHRWRGGEMTATTFDETAAERRDGVSFSRLLWVAPLTVVVALMVWLVPHPIRWFRIVAVIGWLLSLIPDLLLGLGGDSRRMGTSMVAPFSRFGSLFFPAEQAGG